MAAWFAPRAVLAAVHWMVRDINPGTPATSKDSSPKSFVAVGKWIYFAAQDELHGMELWKTDGTMQGTALVKDIYPGLPGSEPRNLVALGDTLLFWANDGSRGTELWRSDGTSSGTGLVKDIGPGISGEPDSTFWQYEFRTVLDGKLLFGGDDGVHGRELWISDGTESGTKLLKDIVDTPAGSSPGGFMRVGDTVFFSAYDRMHGRNLWKTDGTEAGTVRVRPNAPVDYRDFVPDASHLRMGVLGNEVYFLGYDSRQGDGLWKSDGTETGTLLVKDLTQGGESPRLSQFVTSGDMLFILAYRRDSAGDLWTSDGTTSGTHVVVSWTSGGSFPSLAPLEGKAVFSRYADDGGELWLIDGTPQGTSLLRKFLPLESGYVITPSQLSSVGDFVLFRASTPEDGNELWKTDGTPSGTLLVRDIHAGADSSSPYFLAAAQGLLYFSADDGIHGRELWRSDGSAEGTILVSDVCPPSSDAFDPYLPVTLTTLSDRLVFPADDGVHAREAWVSDGTWGGTQLIRDIWPGYYPSNPLSPVPNDGQVYFSANDAYHGRELWVTDGTPAGSRMVRDIFPGTNSALTYVPTSPVFPYKGEVYFQADDGIHGNDLWKSDGTAAGTILLKDFAATLASDSIRDFAPGAQFLFLTVWIADRGLMVWRTDGTSDGTIQLENPDPALKYHNPASLIGGTSGLFFTADRASGGEELWRSDGTASGTLPVKDTSSGEYPRFDTSYSPVENLIGHLGESIVFPASSPAAGIELWKSDGTDTGTIRIKDIFPGPMSSMDFRQNPGFTEGDGVAYFAANDGVHGTELWKTDGIEAGTVLVRDIVPGPEGSVPSHMVFWEGRLYLTAFHPDTGVELWISDGTPEGTSLCADINPGPENSNPLGLAGLGERLYFGANDGSGRGYELWAIRTSGEPWSGGQLLLAH